MRLRIERSREIERAGMHKRAARGVFGLEFHPAFVKVALLGNKAVSDAFILNHDGNGESVASGDFEGLTAQRRDELTSVAFNAENIHIQGSVAQEGDGFFHLRVVAVKL